MTRRPYIMHMDADLRDIRREIGMLSMAPFGTPVVPPVYCSTAMSLSGSSWTGSRSPFAAMSFAKLRCCAPSGWTELLALEKIQKHRLHQRKGAPQRADDDPLETGLAEHRRDLRIDLIGIDGDHDGRTKSSI